LETRLVFGILFDQIAMIHVLGVINFESRN